MNRNGHAILVDRTKTDKKILRSLRTNYTVDIETGEIYSKRTGQPLYRFYCGRDPQRYPFVRVSAGKRRYGRSLARLLWMYSRGRTIPPGFTIHHRNLNHQDNHWKNLIALYKDDHCYLHELLNGYVEEEVPF